jgi:ABC-type uncharacterized transport system substrate-binding protein
VLTLPTSTSSPVFETFRSVVFPELAKQGYVEGSNLVVEIRVGAPDKLPELARELVATRPDAVIAVSSWGVSAVQQASHTTPIVGSFIGVDPIAAGFATSFARPGSNITGVVMLAPDRRQEGGRQCRFAAILATYPPPSQPYRRTSSAAPGPNRRHPAS